MCCHETTRLLIKTSCRRAGDDPEFGRFSCWLCTPCRVGAREPVSGEGARSVYSGRGEGRGLMG